MSIARETAVIILAQMLITVTESATAVNEGDLG